MRKEHSELKGQLKTCNQELKLAKGSDVKIQQQPNSKRPNKTGGSGSINPDIARRKPKEPVKPVPPENNQPANSAGSNN